MKEALYYNKIDNGSVQCILCPHNCIIKQDKSGICRVRKNINGKLYSMNYAKVASYALDPIEKKPLSHFHPGTMISSIGTFGCNLSCDYCQNYELVHLDAKIRDVPSELILEQVKRDGSIGLAYTYNEPTIWYEYVLETAVLIRENNLLNVLVTNGFINPEPFAELAKYIDAMNIDLKFMNVNHYKNICGASPGPVIETIKTANKLGIHVEITNLVISGLNSSSEDIEVLVDTIANINPDIPLHLSRYFPAHKMSNPPTKIEDLHNAYRIAKTKLKYVNLGNV